jgi:hypothetical protein
MLATYCRTDLVGARMMLRIEEGPYDCEALGCDGDPALMTPRDELVESLNCVPLTPPSIHQPDFSHKPLLAEQPYGSPDHQQTNFIPGPTASTIRGFS